MQKQTTKKWRESYTKNSLKKQISEELVCANRTGKCIRGSNTSDDEAIDKVELWIKELGKIFILRNKSPENKYNMQQTFTIQFGGADGIENRFRFIPEYFDLLLYRTDITNPKRKKTMITNEYGEEEEYREVIGAYKGRWRIHSVNVWEIRSAMLELVDKCL